MAYTALDFARDTGVSRETMAQLQAYADTLIKWQSAKNLVATSSLDDVWRRHMLDSAQLAVLIREKETEKFPKIADIGAGAGFPGLVLAIMGVGNLRLIEANGRKCAFMRAASLAAGVDVEIDNRRVEDIKDVKADIIMSRACATLGQLLTWGAPLLAENGSYWFLKGEKADEELTEAKRSWSMTVNRYPSQTDPRGVILHLREVKKIEHNKR